MARNKRYTSPKGTAVYPHLHAPDTKFDADGVYQTKLSVPANEAGETIKLIKQILADTINAEHLGKSKPKLGPLPYTEEDGNVVFKFKMNHNVRPKNGEPFTQEPALFDAAGNKLESGLKIGGGSILRIAYEPYGYKAPFGFGVSLRLLGVQVIDLQTWGGPTADAFGFEAEEGFTSEDADEGMFSDSSDGDEEEIDGEDEDGDAEYSAEDF